LNHNQKLVVHPTWNTSQDDYRSVNNAQPFNSLSQKLNDEYGIK
jgi:hypothetical protein